MKRLKQKLQSYFKRHNEEYEITWQDVEDKKAILVDVRSEQEYNEDHKDGAINIPHYEMKNKAEAILKEKEKAIILYCRSGSRSKKAYEMLKKMGYTNVYHIKNGLQG